MSRHIKELKEKMGLVCGVQLSFDGQLELMHPRARFSWISSHPGSLAGNATVTLGQRKKEWGIEYSLVFDGLKRKDSPARRPGSSAQERFVEVVANVYPACLDDYWSEVLAAVVLHLLHTPLELPMRCSLPGYLARHVEPKHLDLLYDPGEYLRWFHEDLDGGLSLLPFLIYGDGDISKVFQSFMIEE